MEEIRSKQPSIARGILEEEEEGGRREVGGGRREGAKDEGVGDLDEVGQAVE